MTQPARSYDAVVIGGGHNGLICGAYLARAGLSVLIAEKRNELGGAVGNSELAPGVTAPVLAHTIGRLAPSIVRDLRLRDHGLEPIAPAVRVFAPHPEGRAVTLWGDPRRTADELRPLSKADAGAYVGFDAKVRALAGFLAQLQASTPPDLADPSLRDGLTGLRLARALMALEPEDVHSTLRVLPMAVADFVAEWFEDDGLRAALAVRGIQYAAVGPWSAGTTAILLGDSANNDGGAAGQTVFARGGPARLIEALASSARSFGAEIRSGSAVSNVMTREGRVAGVVLEDGREIPAGVVVANVDPKKVVLELADAAEVGPTLRWRASNVRTPGVVAKVNLALGALPRFPTVEGLGTERLGGRLVFAPGIDALERAFDATKYGRIAEAPYLEATIPSLTDPTLTPAETHVMSVVVQYAPYHLRDGNWDERKDDLGDLVLKTLEAYAPGLSDLVTAREVLTPLDLEREYGLTGGHPLHGEPTLDSFFAWRPLLGHAGYRIALDGLYLCGSGAHPGGGVTGGPGANAAREVYRDWVRRRG